MRFFQSILSSLLLFVGAMYGFPKNDSFNLIGKEPKLINLIYRADPSIMYCKDELEIARKLLPIIYQITTSPYGAHWKTKIKANELTAQQFYEQAIRKYDPMLCGGVNSFFSNVLKECFNIKAFAINIGTRGTPMTHVTTVVSVKGTNKFVIFDAYFGCYYTNKYGQYLDLESIFKGEPFIVNCLDLGKVHVLDTTTNFDDYVKWEIDEGKVFLLGHITETKSLYLRHPKILTCMKNCFSQEKQQCTWRDTCILQYLDFGCLFGLFSKCDETSIRFLEMLRSQNIPISESLFQSYDVEE